MTEEIKESVTPNETDAVETTTEQIEDVSLSDDELMDLDEGTSKKIKTAIAQKKHWRDKYEKQQQELEALRSKVPEKKEEPKSEKVGDTEKLELMELKVDNPGIDKGLLKEAYDLAKFKKVEPQEIINSSYFKAMIDESSREARVEGAITGSNDRAGDGGLNFEKISADDTGAEYGRLSSEQKAEYRAHLKKKSGKPGLRFMKD